MGFGCAENQGSPPRVRSRLGYIEVGHGVGGITSACAEQTSSGSLSSCVSGDHLRVCGADTPVVSILAAGVGPPRGVRSRLDFTYHLVFEDGITSACAEQTSCTSLLNTVSRDHLRVCGADRRDRRPHLCQQGSPPRVRSRLPLRVEFGAVVGITSACAEQTPSENELGPTSQDHLRVCGADVPFQNANDSLDGSPPRVRSRHRQRRRSTDVPGITSACAEQTDDTMRSLRPIWDHLRVCGADAVSVVGSPGVLGSPPRVRSRQAGAVSVGA